MQVSLQMHFTETLKCTLYEIYKINIHEFQWEPHTVNRFNIQTPQYFQVYWFISSQIIEILVLSIFITLNYLLSTIEL